MTNKLNGIDVRQFDGLQQLVDMDADYYAQDARGCVGNCASWWRAEGKGYACDLDDAGIYKGSEVVHMRETDVPWPVRWARERVVKHVRGDLFPDKRWRTAPGEMERLITAAREMRENHEGCVLTPPCGSCFRCAFDEAVDALEDK